MKKALALMMALSMGLALAACGSSASSTPAADSEPAASSDAADTADSTTDDSDAEAPAADGDTVVCYSFGPMTGGAAWGQFEKGFYDACEELGWEGHYLAPTTDNNFSEVINLHETAITNGADVLIPLVVDPDAMTDILQQAVDQGITMVGISAQHELIPAVIGTMPEGLGYNMAEALNAAAPEDVQLNVVTMQTTLSTTTQIEQVDAFVDHIMELRPDTVIVSREECNSNAQTAQDRLAAVCIAHPEVNALTSFDSYAGLGAASYVESEGIQDDFYAIGIDDSAEILLAVQAGNLDATVAQMWYNMGHDSVMLASRLRNGEEIDPVTDAGTAIVMPEDVEDWAAKVGADLG